MPLSSSSSRLLSPLPWLLTCWPSLTRWLLLLPFTALLSVASFSLHSPTASSLPSRHGGCPLLSRICTPSPRPRVPPARRGARPPPRQPRVRLARAGAGTAACLGLGALGGKRTHLGLGESVRQGGSGNKAMSACVFVGAAYLLPHDRRGRWSVGQQCAWTNASRVLCRFFRPQKFRVYPVRCHPAQCLNHYHLPNFW